jgi:hypothetical protein
MPLQFLCFTPLLLLLLQRALQVPTLRVLPQPRWLLG